MKICRNREKSILPNTHKRTLVWQHRMTNELHSALRDALQRQGYHILGSRGAFKPCQWQRMSLVGRGTCYKQKFYGIESHRCIQITPVVDKCTHQCEFCWRVTPADLGISWDQAAVSKEEVMSPDRLIDAALEANIRSLGGYNPTVTRRVSREKWLEARDPRHVAISLAGEPTLYPYLNELIDCIKHRGMTSFVVTNGTMPEVIRTLTPPTQLYLTLAAPNRTTYRSVCRPIIKDGWERLLQSQQAIKSLPCRTVNRLTMVAGRNMIEPRDYARLILSGEPDFVEVKGYMFLGESRRRLDIKNTPSHMEIRAFSEKLSTLTGYYLTDEQVESRVVLLSRDKQISHGLKSEERH